MTFQHRDRQQDELRTWASEDELTEERATELAREPVERLWLDADGLRWSIRVELPSDWATEARDGKERALRLVFTHGSLRRVVPVSADTKLGELSHFELARLFNLA